MEKVANTPLGSGNAAEANGLANVQLNGGSSMGVTPKKLAELLEKVINAGNKSDQELLDQIGDYCDQIKDHRIKEKLIRIGNAMQMANDKRKATRDPETGMTDPDAKKLAERLLKHIQPLLKPTRGAITVYNNRLAQQIVKKKKKTRGNPFRVLMGKVGKLLDHGVETNDIVRYLAKMKYWNNETIERAVRIVKEYNKKQKKDVDSKPSKEETKKVVEEVETEMKTHESSSHQNIKTAAFDYATKPDFTKRSTGELIFRACYLMDLLETNENTPQGDFKKVADKKGAKEELSSIKTALVERGFDKEDLSNLGLGL